MLLEPPILCLVTNRHRCLGRPVEEVVAGALDGGVTMVQLREKDMSFKELLPLATKIRKITTGRALFFVNQDLEVALESEADGVQLGEDAGPVKLARNMGGDSLLIGRSVHDLEGGKLAENEGCDLLVAGTVFPTISHPDQRPNGLEFIAKLSSEITIPFIGIGGVKPHNARSLVNCGATGVAVMTAITEAQDPELEATKLRKVMERGLNG